MNITSITLYRFSIQMEPFSIATGTMDYAQNLLIRIYTDSGLEGFGECSAFPTIVGETQETCLVMAQAFANIWKGKDALRIEARLAELHAYCAKNPTVKSAFDMALYDLAAKHAGVPLYQLLGGKKRTVETDITVGIGPLDTMVATASQFAKKGAKTIKIKVGSDALLDIEKVAAIRQAVGQGIAIRIDANQGWSYEDALYALDAMKDLDIQFCEQPMHFWYDDLLPELRGKSTIKIMADESCYNFHDARKLIKFGACDYFNIKLAKSGGIQEALKINSLALSSGIPCMIGGMLESRLALTANLHFAYSADSVRFHDLDTCLLGHLEDPVTGGAYYDGYLLQMSDAPGIGADINEDFLKGCDRWTV